MALASNQPATTALIRLLEVISRNVTFDFDGKDYHQFRDVLWVQNCMPTSSCTSWRKDQTSLKPLFYCYFINGCFDIMATPK